MNNHRFTGNPERLRSPQRVDMLEVERVVRLCLDGIQAHSMLDVGTGSALFAEAFGKHGLRVTGVDVSPDMVQAAKRYVPQGDFRQAPADALPFEDDTFDVVYLGHVLHELDDLERGLREAHRVASQRVAVLEWPYRAQRVGPPMSRRLPAEQVQDRARRAGLAEIDVVELANVVLYLCSCKEYDLGA